MLWFYFSISNIMRHQENELCKQIDSQKIIMTLYPINNAFLITPQKYKIKPTAI